MEYIHDVFINFRGKDTRQSFVSHLNAGLTNAGIKTYIDNQLHKGTELGPELSRAIECSRISILVFSKNYAESCWCLNELQKVIECHLTRNQLVVPVFYDVEPSVVRHQKGAFGQVLRATAKLHSPKLLIWRSALTQAAHFSGWHVKNYR